MAHYERIVVINTLLLTLMHLLVAHSHSIVAGHPICISGSALSERLGERMEVGLTPILHTEQSD